MAEFRSTPLIAEKNNIRIDPFAQPSPSSLPPSVQASMGSTPEGGPSPQAVQAADTNEDGQLDEQEVAELKAASDAGDIEATDLLKGLGLIGGAVGGYAVGSHLAKSMGRGGAPIPAPTARPQLALPAPSQSRALVPAEIPVTQLHETIVPRSAGELPGQPKLPSRAGAALRGAAKAVRRLY